MASLCALGAGEDPSYVKGLELTRSSKFADAIAPLIASYQLRPDAITAYLLSVCYWHQSNYTATLEYGLEALTANPSLPQQYIQSEKDLLTSAWSAKNAPVASTTETHSETGVPQATTDTNLWCGRAKQNEQAAEQRKNEVEGLKARLRPFIDVDGPGEAAACNAIGGTLHNCIPALQSSSPPSPQSVLPTP